MENIKIILLLLFISIILIINYIKDNLNNSVHPMFVNNKRRNNNCETCTNKPNKRHIKQLIRKKNKPDDCTSCKKNTTIEKDKCPCEYCNINNDGNKLQDCSCSSIECTPYCTVCNNK